MNKLNRKNLSIKVSEKSKNISNSVEFVRIKRKVLERISRKLEKVEVETHPIHKTLLSFSNRAVKKIRALKFWPALNYSPTKLTQFDYVQQPGTPIGSQETASIDLTESSVEVSRMPLQF